MRAKSFLAALLAAMPVAADPRQFGSIHMNQEITVVLPNAQCEATVLSRDTNQITAALKNNTPCGARRAIVTLARADVEDVVDERPKGPRRDPALSKAAFCTVLGSTYLAGSAGYYVAATTKGNAPALAVFAGSVAVSAALCRAIFASRAPRYSVFASRLTPPSSKATAP